MGPNPLEVLFAQPKPANRLAQAIGLLGDQQFQRDVGRGLLDAGNRGVVGGLLGAPVDLATMALRPLGYSVEKPVGGSEWWGQKMEDAGLVSPQRNALAESLVALLGPAAVTRAGPSLFAAEQRVAQNLAAPNALNNAARYQRGALYYRNTPRENPDNGVGYMMFADKPDRVESAYGKFGWTFDDAKLPAAEVLDARTREGQREIARALMKDRDLLRSYSATPKALARDANPDNIVDSAGFWDAPDAVGSLWNTLLEPKGYRAVRTADGAVVFDPSLVAPR